MSGEGEGGVQGSVEPSTDLPADPQPQGQGAGQQSEPSYSPASDFLQRVSEEHRPIVEPYVKQWDAGVTRRFQELHSRYSPFEPFLEAEIDPQDMATAWQLYDMMNTDPQYVLTMLQNAVGEQEQGPAGTPPGGDEDPWAGLPPALKQQWDRQSQALEAMAQMLLQSQTQTIEQQEDAKLDEYLGLLHTEFGDFDEEYVITKIGQGMDADKAVEAWNQTVQAYVEKRDRAGQGAGSTAPPVLSGGGGIPLGKFDPKKASAAETRDFAANLLAQANAQRK